MALSNADGAAPVPSRPVLAPSAPLRYAALPVSSTRAGAVERRAAVPLIKDLAWGTKLWTENPELFFLSEYFRRKRASSPRATAHHGEVWSALPNLPDECRVDLHQPEHLPVRRWCPGHVVAGHWRPADPPPAGPEVWKIIATEHEAPLKPTVNPDHARPGLILIPPPLPTGPAVFRSMRRGIFVPVRSNWKHGPWTLSSIRPRCEPDYYAFTASWGLTLASLVDFRRTI